MPRHKRIPNWPRLMQIDDACAYLGHLERETFLRVIAPRLKAIRLDDRVVRFDRDELDKWVDSHGRIDQQRSDDDWLKDIENADD